MVPALIAGEPTMRTQIRTRAKALISQALKRTYPTILNVQGPNTQTIEFIRTTNCRMIAEVGIYRGDTSLQFAKYLNGSGELHLYDFHDRVAAASKMIADAGYTNVKTFGSSPKLLDSYCWSLGAMLDATQGRPVYDYIFLDGAHTWAIDALAMLLSDRLLKVGGFLDFDDYDWTLAMSPTLNPQIFPLTRRLYTDEQIAAPQVKMIVNRLVRTDPRYFEAVKNKIFQKIA